MARYMLKSPAFLPDGNYYEASHDRPLIINLPDDTIPSLTWTPLDAAAAAAAKELSAARIEAATKAGMHPALAKATHRTKPIPAAAAGKVLPAVAVKPTPKVDPNAVDEAIFSALIAKSSPQTGPAEVTIGARPSDVEPD